MRGKKLTTEDFIINSKKIHGNKYDYDKVEYKGGNINILLICNSKHPDFWINPNRHINKKQGCPKCYEETKYLPGQTLFKSRQIKLENFILKSKNKFKDQFDYSEVVYKTNTINIKLICKIHNKIFVQIPKYHLKGLIVCPGCKIEKRFQHWLKQAKKKFENKFDYSKVEYIKGNKKVKIKCKKHGYFLMDPSGHLRSKFGCHECERIFRCISKKEFITKANLIHNNKYNYSKIKFIDLKTKVEIKCPTHGYFWQKPNIHLRNHGCSKCKKYISEAETNWLDILNIPNDPEHRQVTIKYKIENKTKFLKVDGYNPKTKTVYEFNGDYWHGNPNKYNQDNINEIAKCTFGELYQKTLNKQIILEENGYKVISIWESDYYKQLNKTA